MPSIEFLYDEVSADLENIAATSGEFLTLEAQGRVREAAASLRGLRGSPNTVHWTVGREQYRRLETKPSRGECERGDNVLWNVIGTVAFDWQIARVAAGRRARFSIVNASNLVEVLACNAQGAVLAERVPLASWRFEIASGGHPGTLLHSQVNWPPALEGKFEIPRIPSILLTPTETLDFLLGELFQERWPGHCRVTQARWKSSQRGRLLKLLAAQVQQVTGAGDLSAIMQLKAWKPDGLFLYE